MVKKGSLFVIASRPERTAKQSHTEIASVVPVGLPRNDGVPQAPVWIEIDLSAIQHNLRQVRRLVGPRTQVLAVVKANAYGHGLAAVAEALVEAQADLLGVASVLEGVVLRQHGLNSKILVLGQLLPE